MLFVHAGILVRSCYIPLVADEARVSTRVQEACTNLRELKILGGCIVNCGATMRQVQV